MHQQQKWKENTKSNLTLKEKKLFHLELSVIFSTLTILIHISYFKLDLVFHVLSFLVLSDSGSSLKFVTNFITSQTT